MPKISTSDGKVKNYARVFETFGVTLSANGSAQAQADACPWCGKSKFYLNTVTGLYKCHSASCGESGNITQFLTWQHEHFLDMTTDEQYRQLKEKRGIAIQTLKRHELAYDQERGRWLIPFKNPKGDVVKGEVVEASELNGNRKVFVKEGVYKPLIDSALFDKVQRRLALLAGNRRMRKRLYPLTGILFCGHCGSPMHGTRQNDQPPVYRCSAPPHRGSACGRRQVREDQILPFLVRMLGKEIANVRVLLSTPPDHLRNANRQRAEQHDRLQRDREKLTAQIGKAEEYLLLSPDVRTFKALDARLSAMRDELEKLGAELVEEPHAAGYSREELEALNAWWDQFTQTAVTVPVPDMPIEAHLHQDPDAEEAAIVVDPRKLNEALHEVGASCKLWWRTEKGKQRDRHILAKGQFRLGQREGKLPQYLLELSA